MTRRVLSKTARAVLLATLEARFDAHPERHHGTSWTEVVTRLEAAPGTLWSLDQMESTGGEPDVVVLDSDSDALQFADCSPESPAGRRNVCYDRAAQESRKDGLGKANAVDMAAAMGIDLMTEDQYRGLQTLGHFDTKTSSWLSTPPAIRQHGGAIFGEFRFGNVFVCANGAQSFYSARGFRGVLQI